MKNNSYTRYTVTYIKQIRNIYEPYTNRTSYMSHIRNFKKMYRFRIRIYSLVYGRLLWIYDLYMGNWSVYGVVYESQRFHVSYTVSYMDVHLFPSSYTLPYMEIWSLYDVVYGCKSCCIVDFGLCLNSRKLCFSYSLFSLTSVDAKYSF